VNSHIKKASPTKRRVDDTKRKWSRRKNVKQSKLDRMRTIPTGEERRKRRRRGSRRKRSRSKGMKLLLKLRMSLLRVKRERNLRNRN